MWSKPVQSIPSHICPTSDLSMHPQPVKCAYSHILRLPSPEPIDSNLVMLGITTDAAQKMSLLYLQKAEALKKATENIIDLELASIPRFNDHSEFETFLQRLFAAHKRNYEGTLRQWLSKAGDVAQTCLSYGSTQVNALSTCRGRRISTPFKAEYLPLFEYAFSKDRFPSREDKKRLSHISGMSYRQISVWFQNRRCRSGKVTSTNIRSRSVGQVKKRFHFKGPTKITHTKPTNSTVLNCTPSIPSYIDLTDDEDKHVNPCLLSEEESEAKTLDKPFLDGQNAVSISSIIDMGSCCFPSPYNPTTALADPFAVKADSSLWDRRRGQKRPRFSERAIELCEITQDMGNLAVGPPHSLENMEGRNIKPLPKRDSTPASGYLATRSSPTFLSRKTSSSNTLFESSISNSSSVLNIVDWNGSSKSYTRLWDDDRLVGDKPSPSLIYSSDNSSSDSLSSSHEISEHLSSHDSGEESDPAPCHNNIVSVGSFRLWNRAYVRSSNPKTEFRGWDELLASIPSFS